MKITRVAAATSVNGHPVAFQPHTTGLSLILDNGFATGDFGVASLLGEALYGVTPHHAADGLTALGDGMVSVRDSQSEYYLRRQTGPAGVRLTVSGENGHAANANTVHRLTHGLSPNLLGRVFFWQGQERGLLGGLLRDEVAAEYRRAVGVWSDAPRQATTIETSTRFHRRDALAAEIESLLAERRQVSLELEQTTAEIDGRLAAVAGERAAAERRLHAAESELEEIETRLRYHAIAEAAEREVGAQPPVDWEPRLDDIEEEITRWRATLADLEQREAALRTELAQIHPDEASWVLPLADQRAAIAVAGRLTRDIESEVARLARAAGSNACVCQDAHPRLNPLVETLGQQLRRLAELADQQETAIRAQELEVEAEHVARSQLDLRRQLDHLLKRREELWRSGRPRRFASASEQLAEEAIDAAAFGNRRAELQQQVAALRADLGRADAELDDLRRQRDAISHQRGGLLSDERLSTLQRELELAQRELDETRTTTTIDPVPFAGVGRWRASELFAKLTDGRFRALQLIAGGRDVVAIDLHGHERASHMLGDQDRDLAAISLMLAMAAGLKPHGVDLPLVFDNPFKMLDARHTAILANLLEDFARDDHQVLVVTSRAEAIDRFAALGVMPLSRQTEETQRVVTRTETFQRPPIVVETSTPTPPVPVQPAPVQPAIEKRVVTTVREYLLDHDDPIDRFPAVMANRRDVFARARVRTVGELLDADPSALAEELGHDDITAELVALWQTHLSLVCFVPGVSFDDALALTAVGIYSPEDLAEADVDKLYVSMERYLASDAGARLRAKGYSFDRSRVSDLISRGGRGVRHWRSSDRWSRWSRHRSERRNRVATNASRRSSLRKSSAGSSSRSSRSTRSATTRTTSRSRSNGSSREHSYTEQRERKPREYKKRESKERKLRWRLEVDSPVVDAPSIGPKTALKLERVGIHRVDDLLEADAADLAARLDARGVDAEKIVAWQHQAQLVCRIPQIHGHDAQILVACGFTVPEEIGTMQPSELLGLVEPFCSSSEGIRVLRNGSPPDLEEVTNWIAWARESRALGAVS